MKCIAEITGGKYFTVKNADAFNQAMASIVEEVKVIPEINLKVSASEIEGGDFVNAHHTIFNMKNGKKAKRKIARSSNTEGAIHFSKLPVENYLIISKYNNQKKKLYFL